MLLSLEQKLKNGAVNPAQILLNRTIMNVNPNRSGFDAFSLGSTLMSSRSLRQMFNVDETTGETTLRNMSEVIAGKSVRMFDVETSGIFRGSQIVQMATADISSSGKITPGFNATFKSPQLGGLMYGETKPFAELFETGKIIGSENRGKEFLDESVKMINRLIESNSVIAGHNINFDIQKLVGTMKQMGAYSSHSEAQAAVTKLLSGIENGSVTILDTLDYNRAYMNNLVNEAVDAEFSKTGAQRTESEVARLHRSFMYSPETMADVRIGGGAAYASVEAMTLNTDLTARIARDAANGDESAKLLVDRLQKGSHLADVDTILQSFILKYTTTSDEQDRLQLARPGGGRSSSVYQALSDVDKQIADGMRKKVYRSSANVPTKNIADVQHLSEATYNYLLTDKGIKNVTLLEESGDGFIKYDTTENKFLKYGQSETLEYSPGEAEVKRMVQMARSGDAAAIDSIANFGITYGQESRIQELRKIASSFDGTITEEITKDKILQSIGNVYKNFSSKTTLSEAIKISATGKSASAPFEVGFGASNLDEYLQKAIDTAKSSRQGGMSFAFLDTRSKVLNTILSEGTQQNVQDATKNILSMMKEKNITPEKTELLTKQLDSFSYSSYMDILSETGLSHFQIQKEASLGLRVADSSAESAINFSTRVFLPTEILQDLVTTTLGENAMTTEGRVSLSILKNKEAENSINLFWRTKRSNFRLIAEKLVEDSLSFSNLSGSIKAMDGELTKNAILANIGTDINAAMTVGKKSKEQIIEALVQSFDEGGIGYATQGGESARKIIASLLKAGFDASNDMVFSESGTHIDSAGDIVRIAGFADEKAIEVAGLADAYQKAGNEIVSNMNKVAKIIDESGAKPEATRIMTRARLGVGENKVLNFFVNNKKSIYGTGAGILAAGVGYYMYGNYKENQIYDETLEEQPSTYKVSNGEMMQNTMRSTDALSSYRRDPLVTAGVVGNLDRSKIGHYSMSPKKHSHLFGG